MIGFESQQGQLSGAPDQLQDENGRPRATGDTKPPFQDTSHVRIGVCRRGPSFPLDGDVYGSLLWRNPGCSPAPAPLCASAMCICRTKGLPQGMGSSQGQGWQMGGHAGLEQQRWTHPGGAGAGGRRQEEAGPHREVAPGPWEMLHPT